MALSPFPIETGPRDGTHILAANLNQAHPIWTAVHWFDDRWYLSVNELELHAGWQCDRLTHWLPQPPIKLADFPSTERAPALAPFEKLIEHWSVWSRRFSPKEVSIINMCREALAAVVEEVRGK